MTKKKAIKVIAASAVAASSFAAVAAPHNADAASTSISTQVKNAKTTMRNAMVAYYNAPHYVKAAAMEAPIQKAKKAYEDTKAAVKKSKYSYNQRLAWISDLTKDYKHYVYNAINYQRGITQAYNAKLDILDLIAQGQAAVAAKDLAKAEETQAALSKALDDQAYNIKVKVVGTTPEKYVLEAFNAPLAKQAEDLAADVAKLKEELATPAVQSVSAINAKTIQVTFNKAIKESSIAGATIATDITSATIADKKLSEDGKTLTLTLGTAYLTSTAQDVKVTIKDLLDSANNKVEDYAKVVSLKDDVRPTLDDVTFADSKTLKVPVSEPLNADNTDIYNSLTITDANGSPVDTTGLSASSVSYDETDGYFTINLASLTTPLDAGTYTLKFTGLKDYAGNLINSNPTTKTITVAADETAPTVASIANVGYVGTDGYLKINFSEPVQSLVGAKVTLNNGSAVTLAAGDIVSTSQDKKSAVIKLASATTDYQSVVIEDFKDLAGNPGKKYTGSVKFGASTPTVASYEYSASKETQTVTFDRPVSFVTGSSATLTGTKVYDNVESSVSGVIATINPDGQLVINTTNLTSGKYTLALPVNTVKDVAGQQNKATTLTFTLDKTGVVSQVQFADFVTDGTGTTAVAAGDTPVQTGGVVYVKFDNPVGDSAVDVNNYTIEGVNVFSNAVFTNTTKNVVKLTLKEDTIAKDNNYTFAISNVKDTNDKAVKAYSGAYLFNDNTTPTLTALTVKDNTNVYATFSEAIAAPAAGALDADDFVVTVNGAVVTPAVTVGTLVDANKVTFTLPAALAQNAEVKVTVSDTADFTDVSSALNVVKVAQSKTVIFK